jgi:hypothetical protein
MSAAAGVRPPPPDIDWRLAMAIAALIAFGPLLTIVGGTLLEHEAKADTARIEARMEARTADIVADRKARSALRSAVREAPLAVWFDRLAVALPPEARLARMERRADGTIEAEILTPDPDLLRGALRRHPALAGFREAAQRRADGMILVTVRRAG